MKLGVLLHFAQVLLSLCLSSAHSDEEKKVSHLHASLSPLFPMRLCSFLGTPECRLCLPVWLLLEVQAGALIYTCRGSYVHPRCMAGLDNKHHHLNTRTGLSLLAHTSGGLVPSFLGRGAPGLFLGGLRWVWKDFPALWSCGKGIRGLSALEGLCLKSHSRIGVFSIEWTICQKALTHFNLGSGGFLTCHRIWINSGVREYSLWWEHIFRTYFGTCCFQQFSFLGILS